VALAGADFIKFGLAEQSPAAAAYLANSIVRTVRRWFPRKRLIPSVFLDTDMTRFFHPLRDGPGLVAEVKADGLLIDTFNKSIELGLLDYLDLKDIRKLAATLHSSGRECWIAGSIVLEELPALWATGIDVVCVRAAACRPTEGVGRFAQVDASVVRKLVDTLPSKT
jgi:uncharacterized protein (UPF0264 family)